MTTRTALLATLLLSFFSACGPPWKVVRVSGPPSALAGVRELAVAFDYSQLAVEGRSEQAWVAEKTAADPKYPDTWADLKGRFEQAVLEGVQGEYPAAHRYQAPGPGAVMLVAVRTFRLGKWIPFAMPPTVMEGSVQFQVNGQTTDEIALLRSYQASVTQPSVFNHIGWVGYEFGRAGGRVFVTAQER